jgi:hypothetical protein
MWNNFRTFRPALVAVLQIASLLPAFAADPSTVAWPDPWGKQKFAERHRIVADLDGDQVDDLLLSGNRNGKAGLIWTVYLKRGDAYIEVGSITAHPMAISIEPDHDRSQSEPDRRFHARIWTFEPGSGREGTLGYYRVGEKKIEDFTGVEIYPGDAGTELGNAVYKAAFAASPIPFRMEESTTDADGTVHWELSK